MLIIIVSVRYIIFSFTLGDNKQLKIQAYAQVVMSAIETIRGI